MTTGYNLAPKPSTQVMDDRRVVIAKERYDNAIRYRISVAKTLQEAEAKEIEARKRLEAIQEVVTNENWYEPDPAFDRT